MVQSYYSVCGSGGRGSDGANAVTLFFLLQKKTLYTATLSIQIYMRWYPYMSIEKLEVRSETIFYSHFPAFC